MFRGLQSQLQRSLIFPACGAPARKILFQNSRITYILESHYKTRGKWRRRVPAGNWAAESRKARAVADSGTYDRPNTEEGYDCLWYTHKQITTVFRAMPMHATQSERTIRRLTLHGDRRSNRCHRHGWHGHSAEGAVADAAGGAHAAGGLSAGARTARGALLWESLRVLPRLTSRLHLRPQRNMLVRDTDGHECSEMTAKMTWSLLQLLRI